MTDQSTTVALIHAVMPAIQPMREAMGRGLPQARVLNLLDEGLLSEVERRGGLVPECVDRLATQVGLAIEAGADAVLLTCTAYSPVVDEIQARFPSVPVFPVDKVMVEAAVGQAARIGVLGTVPAGIAQQREMLRQAAAAAGKTIEVIESVHPAAFTALQRGDRAEHDRILLEALPALAAQVDLVLLGQASMAHLASQIPADLGKPVLSSPDLAVERVRQIVSK
jgi:Asp/Glu/hydantoin racemase